MPLARFDFSAGNATAVALGLRRLLRPGQWPHGTGHELGHLQHVSHHRFRPVSNRRLFYLSGEPIGTIAGGCCARTTRKLQRNILNHERIPQIADARIARISFGTWPVG